LEVSVKDMYDDEPAELKKLLDVTDRLIFLKFDRQLKIDERDLPAYIDSLVDGVDLPPRHYGKP